MQEESTRGIYDAWSHIYDLFCWRIIVTRRTSRAIQRMQIQPGQRVLDLGIGTGLALPDYPKHCELVGVDLSESMLSKARKRVLREDLTHADLCVANALQLPFADHSFDHVLASHLVTVVSDPHTLISEICRVAKPQAQVVIINHFRSANPMVGRVESLCSPLFEKLGWRTDLGLHEMMDNTDLRINYRYKLSAIDLFQSVFATNTAGQKERANGNASFVH